ncbi:predicted protein [Streptomyces sp. C]|nr:predicted protein [Streptomyces sp. C]
MQCSSATGLWAPGVCGRAGRAAQPGLPVRTALSDDTRIGGLSLCPGRAPALWTRFARVAPSGRRPVAAGAAFAILTLP